MDAQHTLSSSYLFDMMKPKFSFKQQNAIEFYEDIFVDRLPARKKFEEFISCKDKDFNILMYYGVGGIGKSSLLTENITYFKENVPNPLCFHVDLNDVNKRYIGATLQEFVDDCSNNKIRFDAFNLAYAMYFSKKHSGEEYGRDKNNISNKLYLPLKIIGIWDDGKVEVVTNIISKVIDYARKKKLPKEILDDLGLFDSLSLTEIETRLSAYFQYDVTTYLNENPETHVLFTIDTFEALNVQETETLHRRLNESWIQDIIQQFEQCPHCRFVICGRDKLEWGTEWDQYIEQFELTDFTEEWSRKYLIEAGINNNDIIDKIIKGSNGHPFCMYLSAKTYIDIRNRGREPVVSDFGTTPKEIIHRFIYNLDSEEVDILKYLSIPNYFSNEIFEYVLSAFHIACHPERFAQLISYSFIQDPIDGDYYIHSLMREGLQESCKDEPRKRVNELMLNYYTRQCDTFKNNAKPYAEMVYHASKLMDSETFNKWFEQCGRLEFLKEMQLKGEQARVFQITEGLFKQYGLNNVNIDVVNIYIDALHLGGNYEAAVTACENYLSPYTKEEIIASEGLCKLRIRKIHHSMFYTPADGLISEVEAIIANKKVDQYPEQYNELLFLLGGNLGVLSGRFDFAERWLKKAIGYARLTKKDNHILRSARKLADLMTLEGNPTKAVSFINQYISTDSNIEKRYEIYIIGSLGEAYRKAGRLDKAELCYRIVDAKSSAKNLPGWLSHAEMGTIMLDYDEGNYDEVLKKIPEVKEKYKRIRHSWGIINSSTVELMALAQKRGIDNIKKEVATLRADADKMNYRYNVSILDELIQNGKVSYFQLLFL